ncbi:MAG: FkbM family methyltransferase, partial [Pseudomonadota bacterium]
PLEGHIGKGPLTVLDVGANTGTWTKAWLDAFGDRTTSVHMFEPHSRNVKEIRRRIAEGFFDEIGVGWASKLRIVPQAVGAKSARAPLRFGLAEARVSSLAQATSRLMGLEASLGEVETVPVTTLDTYLASVDLPHINVLRIGTEGFELPVLQGAAAALRSGRIGTILFEFGMHQLASRHTLEDFWTLLEPLEYRFHRFGLGRRGWGLTPITEYRRGLEELHTINVFMAQRPPRTT